MKTEFPVFIVAGAAISFLLLLAFSQSGVDRGLTGQAYSAALTFQNVNPPPAQVNINTPFQIKCDYSGRLPCMNARVGNEWCAAGNWEGASTSLVFNCRSSSAGNQDVFCNTFYWAQDPRCLNPQQNKIGTVNVIDPNAPTKPTFKNSGPPPAQVNINTPFQIKCDYGIQLACLNARVGNDYCTAGPWDGTAAVFNCKPTSAGNKDVSCNTFYYAQDSRCLNPQQNKIGATEVYDPNAPLKLSEVSAPVQVKIGQKFEVLCGYGRNDLQCLQVKYGTDFCAPGPWKGNSAVFYCDAKETGTKDVNCNLFYYPKDIRCVGQTNKIGATEVFIPERSAVIDMAMNEKAPMCGGYYQECSPVLLGQYCTVCSAPSGTEITNTMDQLGKYYTLNKVYLLYHKQFPIEQYKSNLLIWKQAADRNGIKLVPALLINRMEGGTPGDSQPNFIDAELLDIVKYANSQLGNNEIAIFDTMPDTVKRDYSRQVSMLKASIPGLVITRLAAQPSEIPNTALLAKVNRLAMDDWTYVTACDKNADWLADKGPAGWNRAALSAYVTRRNTEKITNVWTLVTVGWPYEPGETSDTCRFTVDDAKLNDPIPADRNKLTTQLICAARGNGEFFQGFHSDFQILGVTSNVRDTPDKNFLGSLKRGQPYTGVFSAPLEEIRGIFTKPDPCAP